MLLFGLWLSLPGPKTYYWFSSLSLLYNPYLATLYTPVFKIYFPSLPLKSKKKNPKQDNLRSSRTVHLFRWKRNEQQTLAADEDAEIIPPIGRSNNPYRDIAVYGSDVIICGLVMYFSAIVGTPPFGDGSPFYRYGFSSIFAAAFAYRYRGGLAAAIGYDFFAVLGLFFPPPMAHLPYTLVATGTPGFNTRRTSYRYFNCLYDHTTKRPYPA